MVQACGVAGQPVVEGGCGVVPLLFVVEGAEQGGEAVAGRIHIGEAAEEKGHVHVGCVQQVLQVGHQGDVRVMAFGEPQLGGDGAALAVAIGIDEAFQSGMQRVVVVKQRR